ncbi:hypothetical protein F5Y08DRAFT_340098 [Xylaria arbuscula]|nr:hypothetical protein F5Y08DRAFT_340098 [Xylaria arbuscula]
MARFTSINKPRAQPAGRRERSQTMSPNPHYEEEQNHTNSEPEEGDDHTLSDTIDDDFSNRLILSIDFGTTYSAVSYIALRAGRCLEYISSNDICSIENYLGDKNREEGN